MIKKFVSIFTLILLVGSSCNEKHLNVAPGFITEESFFKEEADFERAIYGVYAKMSDFYWYNGGQNNFAPAVTVLPGDDITTTGDDEFEIFANINPNSGRLIYLYGAIYQMVSRANVVLEKLKNVGGNVYTTAGRKSAHEGEALFLRGYGHYLLWNIFGTSPVRNTRLLSLADSKPASSTGTELLDQAITDFTAAAGLLPTVWDASNRGRVTSNSAYGMLGKALVFRGTVNNAIADHTAAIAAFNKITSSVQLVPKFDDNYAYDTENNAESLFEFQASQAFGFDNVWLANDFDNAVGAMSTYWGFFDNHFTMFGKPPFIATDKLVNIFEAGDPRKNLTVNGSKAIVKYVSRDKLNQGGSSSVNNPRILRYADVLLLKAEAINESGGSTAEAIGLINQLRARARGAGVAPLDRSVATTDRAVIRQWIMDERMMELAGESQRWFDLRRWALAGKVSLNSAFFNSANSQINFDPSRHLNFPIPTSETNVNPNIKQNANY